MDCPQDPDTRVFLGQGDLPDQPWAAAASPSASPGRSAVAPSRVSELQTGAPATHPSVVLGPGQVLSRAFVDPWAAAASSSASELQKGAPAPKFALRLQIYRSGFVATVATLPLFVLSLTNLLFRDTE